MDLTPKHLRVLEALAEHGPADVGVLDEEVCDDLFKMKPRLIALVQGREEPVVDITSEGLQRLVAEKEAKEVSQ